MNLPLTSRQKDVLNAMKTGAPDGRTLTLRLKLEGPLDRHRLAQAAETVAASLDATTCVLRNAPEMPVLISGEDMPFSGLRIGTDETACTSGATFAASLQIDSPTVAQLLLQTSPAICDRAGLALIAQRIITVYAGEDVPEEDIGLLAYMEWRAGMETAPEAATGKAYWQDILKHQPSLPGLPGKPRSGERRTVTRHLPGKLLHDLSGWDLPLDAVLQAAWWIAIARTDDLASMPRFWQHDSRNDYPPMQDLAGPLDDRLPLAATPEPDETVSHFLERFHAELNAHRSHQEHRPASSASGDEGAIGFALGKDWAAIPAGGITWAAAEHPGPHPVFDLALDAVMTHDGAVRLDLHYDPARHGADKATLLLDRYLAVLAALPRHRDTSVQALPVLTETEIALHAALAAPEPVDDPETMPALLVRWALQRPLAPALVSGEQTWTYNDLEEKTRRLACHLARRGIGPGALVALVMPRSALLVLALHAVMRAGAAFVPLDPGWPAARRNAIIGQTAPALVWDETTVADLLGRDELLPSIVLPSPAMTDVAYVLFTSGSTGTPKGVVVEHGQLASYVAAARKGMALSQCRRFALSSTVAADLGHTALFGALSAGAALVIASDEDMADSQSFGAFLSRQAIDCIKITPSHLGALLDTSRYHLPSAIVLGGEAPPPKLIETIRRRSPGSRIFNHYGPTETTVGAMIGEVPAGQPLPDAIPLDKPLAGCRILLRRADFTRTPAGAIGEIYIGGAQVARGYLGEPAGRAFRDDPERPGERLYRTGDLARLNLDGSLTLAGRADDQVKIRGFRIELAEVEAALASLPGVAQAVAAVTGEGDGRQIVTYLTAENGYTPDLKAIGGQLRSRLPDAAVPSTIAILPDMPRLPNGKIDRAALPALETAGSEPANSAHETTDPLEALVAELIHGLLGTDRIGREDNIFDLGAHSLIVIKLAARLRKRLDIPVPPSLIFEHPSIALLSERLRGEGVSPGQLPALV
ncbi:non-ribosomal peptide synthetase [Novosphingobium beihaiensis]|uniref:Amino acid adenylation domain-containing protein n=1 Tax=Novosphingobium beihaiensis TaxID=2930389 RepID=A0ABT0BTC4_9SPHN|nr:non-ribosomal peptide synthetase [Novosphingobium beihaiensis]MCJ2188282.1 amino acid adenylation domain-containing protein [Novosphingobium beihaiensis]